MGISMGFFWILKNVIKFTKRILNGLRNKLVISLILSKNSLGMFRRLQVHGEAQLARSAHLCITPWKAGKQLSSGTPGHGKKEEARSSQQNVNLFCQSTFLKSFPLI